jgi:CRISPR system Cascade subunit CasA
MTFSLLTEAWIPLIGIDGSRRDASLREALLEPHHWRGIDGGNPVETLSLYRLLLAIAHRACGPSSDVRAPLMDAWPQGRLSAYLDEWADHFDLLHPEKPFLQVQALSKCELTPSPWARLALDRASGAARMIWDHSVDERPVPQQLASVARLLIAHLQFTPGGLVKALRTSAVRGPACSLLLMMPLGETLQQTLALNLITQTKPRYANDLPSWERTPLTIKELQKPLHVVIDGPAHRYTFLSRAVLILSEGGLVSKILYAEGLTVGENTTPEADPMAAMVMGKKGPMPLLLNEQKSFWRDYPALCGSKESTEAAVVSHGIGVREKQEDGRRLDLLAGGLLCDQAKILFWRLEQRCLRPLVLRNQNLIAASDRALDLAEDTGRELNKSVYLLCSEWLQRGGEKDPDPKDIRALQSSLQALPIFWSGLEGAFWSFIDHLGQCEDHSSALNDWRMHVSVAMESTWTHAQHALGFDSRALAAAGSLDHRRRKMLALLKD